MTFPVHNTCAALHSLTNNYEADAKHYLRKLAELRQSGFDPGTMPMRQLEADAITLRFIANMIEELQKELTKPEMEMT